MNEYIITKEQIEELNRAHGGMKIATSWLSCYAIWDISNTYPVMKSEHVAVTLPEIVRCRDCEHMRELHPLNPITGVPAGITIYRCSYFWTVDELPEVEPDGFCAWGERKDGDAL